MTATSTTAPVIDPAGADALTADGGIVHIRPVAPADRGRLAGLYERASSDSLRLRFFITPSRAMIVAELDRLCRPTGDRGLALLAELPDAVVGVASFECPDATDPRAEFAVFVDERHRGRGIGTLLLEHLAAEARKREITELIGEVLPDNSRMLHVARDLTTGAHACLNDGVVDIGLVTDSDDSTQQAVDARDRTAERASLHPLFAPASVAVVGAGRTRGGVGHETLRALREYGYTGRLYAVNRHTSRVLNTPAYRRVADLPEPVDLLVIAVPADEVPGVLAEAGGHGVGAAVVLSAGFGEAGPQGRAAQADLVRLARRHGIRLVGPNCLGIINTEAGVRLNASFAPAVPPPGGLAVASQSGAVGIALLQHAAETGCGISTFISLGNKADVSGNDLIAYWFDDPATTAVALYLESFGNPRKFARTVRALARRKPVIAVKSGRSTAGRRAGASHTAAAAAADVTVDALFAQAGVIRVDNLGELLDAARVLTDQPLPAGNRIGVVGNAGGLNVLTADAAERGALCVPSLRPATREHLATLAPETANPDNPLDLGAGASATALAGAVEALAASGDVDALLVVLTATRANCVEGILSALGPVIDRYPALPVIAVVTGMTDTVPTLGQRRCPVFTLPERAVGALDRATRYATWRREPLGRRADLTGVDAPAARAVVAAALTTGPGWQPYDVTNALLSAYGVHLLPCVTVRDPDSAVATAESVGFPVVLKSADPQLFHKSDVGGVRLGLTDATAVRDAYRTVVSAGRPDRGVLVQRQAPASLELVTGVVHDTLFGSLVMLGLGGVYTDLLADRCFRLTPMTDVDAGQMWRSLRAAALLRGYRGAAPVDTTAVEDLLLRLGRLAEDVPEVAELDLNPVLVGPDGIVAVDAKLRLAQIGAEPDPALRLLRQPDQPAGPYRAQP